MRGFRFRLARLERVRGLAESQERAEYGRAQARLREAEEEVQRVVGLCDQALGQQLQARSNGAFDPASELASQQLIERLEQHIDELRKVQITLQARAESQRLVWENARRELRTLDRLRERDLSVHLEDLEAQEREEQDEWASSRGAGPSRDSGSPADAPFDGASAPRRRS